METDLGIGDVVLTHHVRRIAGQDERGEPTLTLDFTAPKDHDFVFVMLGTAKRAGEVTFHVEDAMRRLGWKRTNEKP